MAGVQYFDATVHDHIVKTTIPAADVDALPPLIARRKVMVYLGPTNVNELVREWKREPAAAIEPAPARRRFSLRPH